MLVIFRGPSSELIQEIDSMFVVDHPGALSTLHSGTEIIASLLGLLIDDGIVSE